MKKALKILFFLVIIGIIIFSLSHKEKKSNQHSGLSNPVSNVYIAGNKFEAEKVSTGEKKERGLSGRRGLCTNCAMLFVYEKKGVFTFWMKGMKFDLDIIWISDEKVSYIGKNASYKKGIAEKINPGIEADMVLEINAGMSDKLGIKIGDPVIID